MALHKLTIRTAIAAFGIMAATAWNAQVARGQYTFVQDSDSAAAWSDIANWLNSGSPAVDYPNAPGATVLITAPISTTVGAYTLTLPATDTTVGELKIDNAAFSNNFDVTFADGGAQLIFQSPSGLAKYTETAGTSTGTPTPNRYTINSKITLNSDLELTQDNVPTLNTGTTFNGLITGDSTRTITKKGNGSIQFNFGSTATTEGAFQGQLVIENGGVRMINSWATLSKSTGVTVKSGGQFELADNANKAVPNFKLDPAAVLNLNGNGKSLATAASPTGALQVEIQATRTTTFQNPVVLQTTSNINVSTANSTGALQKAVSGPGGLIKSGNGLLSLLDTDATSSYTGNTQVLAGTLNLSHAFLNDAADVLLPAETSTARLNLNFAGTDIIHSLLFNNVAQASGTWGALSSGADHTTALITGTGLLQVPAAGLLGDFNSDGKVDAADYVTWRKNDSANATLPNDNSVGNQAARYTLWRANFGNPPGAGSSLGQAAVPEPTTVVLLISIVPLFAGRRPGRKRM
jgi:autotransporter-associated beta strand protein